MRKFQASKIPLPLAKLPPICTNHLDVEIGCGVGLHSVTYAKANPNRVLVAIDKSSVRFEKMMDRIRSVGGMDNLIPIRENAVWFVTHEISPSSVENYFFLYPNPYPKKRQANKRWYQMPFMEHVLETLKKKGRIHLATNIDDYASEAQAYLIHEWKMKLIEKQIYSSLHQCPFEPRTHFEKKYLERGNVCWNQVFEKN